MNAYDHVIAIGAAAKDPRNGDAPAKVLLGTAFPIGQGFFITAAHVLRDALTYEWPRAFGVRNNHSEVHYFPIHEHELHEDFDIAIFKAETHEEIPMSWNKKELPMLESVYTFGYPYALDVSLNLITIRAFKGHLITAATSKQIPSSPRIYELSFPCPRGLSGAPLFSVTNNTVEGVIVGNQDTEMLILSDTETISENGAKHTTIVERYESLQTGVALQSTCILGIQSKLLGSKVEDHLIRLGLA